MKVRLTLFVAVLFVAVLYALRTKNERHGQANLSSQSAGEVAQRPQQTKSANLTAGFPPSGGVSDARPAAPERSTDRGAHKPIDFQQDPFAIPHGERLKNIKLSIGATFGKAIAALKLTPADEDKLLELLIQRADAAYIAHEVVQELGTSDYTVLTAMIAKAQADVDQEIQQYFSGNTADQIAEMVRASSYLAEIRLAIDPALTSAGAPIAPEQALPLALVLRETYGAANDFERIPSQANMDPKTGLLPLDEVAIQRAATVLNTRQLEVFQKLAAERNREYLKRNS